MRWFKRVRNISKAWDQALAEHQRRYRTEDDDQIVTILAQARDWPLRYQSLFDPYAYHPKSDAAEERVEVGFDKSS